MTPEEQTRVLAGIKLAELRRQRALLNERYTAVEQRSQGGPSLEELRALFEGLGEIRFAQKPLHPDAANLEVLFFEAEAGPPSSPLIDNWTGRFRGELAQGRLRAEFAYVFGGLLEEHLSAPGTSGEDGGGNAKDWSILWNEAPPVDLALLRQVFARHETIFAKVRDSVRKFGEGEARAPVTPDEVKALLGMLAGGIYRQPAVRRLAAATLASSTLVTEYAGALTILLHNLNEWSWPPEGVPLRSLWTRNRWRPYLDEDMVTVLFLQLVGLRWGMHLKRLFRRDVDTPRGIFSEDEGRGWPPYVDGERRRRYGDLFLPMVPEFLAAGVGGEGYGGGYGGGGRDSGEPGALEKLFATLAGDIRFRQAAFPDRPLLVVQTDLRDYYLSIPHPVVMAVVEALGFPPEWQEFMRRYLPAPMRAEEEVRTVRRGVLLDHLLGAVLADWLLLLLDVHVHDTAGIRPLRLVDDLYLLADSAERAENAWQAVSRFCEACGLEINEQKSGAVSLAGPAAAGLPEGKPRWGLLRLQADGAWGLDEPALDQLQEWLRQQLEAAPSVLAMVARYNDHVAYIQRSMGLPVRLGPAHLERVGRRLARLHHAVFGEGHGILEEMRRRISARFPDLSIGAEGLPDALFYWPITAGGLGLTHPLVSPAAFRKGLAAAEEPEPPAAGGGSQPGGAGERDDADEGFVYEIEMGWYAYYSGLCETVAMAQPAATPALQSLMQDFIARGGEVGGRQQEGLSTYWQWVLYTYGPSLLESLGTFRFLLRELVPLQLILEHRIDASSLGAGPGEGPGA
jgi:hypothetical protein